MKRPSTWEVEPDEYYGEDVNGATYWRIHGEVLKHLEGATRWFSTVMAFLPHKERILKEGW